MPRDEPRVVEEHIFPSLAAAKTALLNHKDDFIDYRQKLIDLIADRSNINKRRLKAKVLHKLQNYLNNRGVLTIDSHRIRVNIAGDIQIYTIQQIVDFLQSS